ncbi:unnamed protein product, partial [Anisakis simplex]|uniref:Leishmanolysin-like peptidase n=1 Tax=Anisakis simplex TaxID=6269 RepID=A0A0M3J4G2_ANISI
LGRGEIGLGASEAWDRVFKGFHEEKASSCDLEISCAHMLKYQRNWNVTLVPCEEGYCTQGDVDPRLMILVFTVARRIGSAISRGSSSIRSSDGTRSSVPGRRFHHGFVPSVLTSSHPSVKEITDRDRWKI